jgi:hypothetical protein
MASPSNEPRRRARRAVGAHEEAQHFAGDPRPAKTDRVVDLSHVAAFEDFALAVLAQELGPERRDRVTLRGLRRRQERILRYFGVARVERQSDSGTSRHDEALP